MFEQVYDDTSIDNHSFDVNIPLFKTNKKKTRKKKKDLLVSGFIHIAVKLSKNNQFKTKQIIGILNVAKLNKR